MGLEVGTPHQKGTQVKFWLPARIPAAYEPPWCRKIKKSKKSTEGYIFIVVRIIKSKYSAVKAKNIVYKFLVL